MSNVPIRSAAFTLSGAERGALFASARGVIDPQPDASAAYRALVLTETSEAAPLEPPALGNAKRARVPRGAGAPLVPGVATATFQGPYDLPSVRTVPTTVGAFVAAASDDGTVVAVAGGDASSAFSRLDVWALGATGFAPVYSASDSPVHSVAVSRDGQFAAFSSGTRYVRVVSLAAAGSPADWDLGAGVTAASVQFLNNGDLAAMASDGSVFSVTPAVDGSLGASRQMQGAVPTPSFSGLRGKSVYATVPANSGPDSLPAAATAMLAESAGALVSRDGSQALCVQSGKLQTWDLASGTPTHAAESDWSLPPGVGGAIAGATADLDRVALALEDGSTLFLRRTRLARLSPFECAGVVSGAVPVCVAGQSGFVVLVDKDAYGILAGADLVASERAGMGAARVVEARECFGPTEDAWRLRPLDASATPTYGHLALATQPEWAADASAAGERRLAGGWAAVGAGEARELSLRCVPTRSSEVPVTFRAAPGVAVSLEAGGRFVGNYRNDGTAEEEVVLDLVSDQLVPAGSSTETATLSLTAGVPFELRAAVLADPALPPTERPSVDLSAMASFSVLAAAIPVGDGGSASWPRLRSGVERALALGGAGLRPVAYLVPAGTTDVAALLEPGQTLEPVVLTVGGDKVVGRLADGTRLRGRGVLTERVSKTTDAGAFVADSLLLTVGGQRLLVPGENSVYGGMSAELGEELQAEVEAAADDVTGAVAEPVIPLSTAVVALADPSPLPASYQLDTLDEVEFDVSPAFVLPEGRTWADVDLSVAVRRLVGGTPEDVDAPWEHATVLPGTTTVRLTPDWRDGSFEMEVLASVAGGWSSTAFAFAVAEGPPSAPTLTVTDPAAPAFSLTDPADTVTMDLRSFVENYERHGLAFSFEAARDPYPAQRSLGEDGYTLTLGHEFRGSAYNLGVVVTNKWGLTSTLVVRVTEPFPPAPTALQETASPPALDLSVSHPLDATIIPLDLLFEDPAGDPLSFEITQNYDGAAAITDGSLVISRDYRNATYTIEITATSSRDASTSWSLSITEPDSPTPSWSTTSYSVGTSYPYYTVDLDSRSTDATNRGLTYTLVGGTHSSYTVANPPYTTNISGATLQFANDFRNASRTVIVRATNQWGKSADGTFTFSEQSAPAPTLQSTASNYTYFYDYQHGTGQVGLGSFTFGNHFYCQSVSLVDGSDGVSYMYGMAQTENFGPEFEAKFWFRAGNRFNGTSVWNYVRYTSRWGTTAQYGFYVRSSSLQNVTVDADRLPYGTQFYRYNYDGGAQQISDGGGDMFDSGHYVYAIHNGVGAALNKTSGYPTYWDQKYMETLTYDANQCLAYLATNVYNDPAGRWAGPSWPHVTYTALAKNGTISGFGIKTYSGTGADGGGSRRNGFIHRNANMGNSVYVVAFYDEVYGTNDPSVLEIKCIFAKNATWSNYSYYVNNSGTGGTDPMISYITGDTSANNAVACSLLLSRPGGRAWSTTYFTTIVSYLADGAADIFARMGYTYSNASNGRTAEFEYRLYPTKQVGTLYGYTTTPT